MPISSLSEIGISTNVQIINDELVVADATAVYFGGPTFNKPYI